jgi:outer membrane receptor for Fe3+-dicitrate
MRIHDDRSASPAVRMERLQLQLNLKNVTNRRYYITGAGSNVGFPGEPRHVRAALVASF